MVRHELIASDESVALRQKTEATDPTDEGQKRKRRLTLMMSERLFRPGKLGVSVLRSSL